MRDPANLPALLQSFFTTRLMTQRKVSPHTIASYRDTFRLLLQFAQKRLRKAPSELGLDDLDASLVGAFLEDLHVLPHRFVRIRQFGFLSGRRRGGLLPLCKSLLAMAAPATPEAYSPSAPVPSWTCPLCGGAMLLLERFTAIQLRLRSPPPIKVA